MRKRLMRVNYDAAIDKLKAAFEDSIFSYVDAGKVLNVAPYTAACVIRYGREVGKIKRVITSLRLALYVGGQYGQPRHLYSFDLNKEEHDALDAFDPIPANERALDIQLKGDEFMRYLDIYTHKRAAIQMELSNEKL